MGTSKTESIQEAEPENEPQEERMVVDSQAPKRTLTDFKPSSFSVGEQSEATRPAMVTSNGAAADSKPAAPEEPSPPRTRSLADGGRTASFSGSQRLVSAHGNLFMGTAPSVQPTAAASAKNQALPRVMAQQSHHFAPTTVPPPVNRSSSNADSNDPSSETDRSADWRDAREVWVPPSQRRAASPPPAAAKAATAQPKHVPAAVVAAPPEPAPAPAPAVQEAGRHTDKNKVVSSHGNLFMGISSVAESSAGHQPSWKLKNKAAAAAAATPAASAPPASSAPAQTSPASTFARAGSISRFGGAATTAAAPAAVVPQPEPQSASTYSAPSQAEDSRRRGTVSSQGNLFQGIGATSSSTTGGGAPSWRSSVRAATAFQSAPAPAAAPAAPPQQASPPPQPEPADEAEPDSLAARMAAFGRWCIPVHKFSI